MAANGSMEIRLIGNFAVIRDGKPVPMPGSRKTRGLLAFLILSPGPHHRDRLCEIFWQLPHSPGGALQWSLSKLRHLVDDDETKRIVADRETVAFDPEGVDIDVLQLRDTLSDGLQDLDGNAEGNRGSGLAGVATGAKPGRAAGFRSPSFKRERSIQNPAP